MPTISEYLRMLRDVDGVHGSFVVAGSGMLVDSDLPSVFDAEVLGEVGAARGPPLRDLLQRRRRHGDVHLRYAEHKLYVRKMTWGIIGVLSTVGVNLPALRMVANLVIRRIDPEIAAISSTNSTVTKTLPSAAPQPTTERAPADPMASALLPSLPAHMIRFP